MRFGSSPHPVAPTTNYQKYQSANPLIRLLIERFLDRVVALVTPLAPRRIVDLGCGEGVVGSTLHERLRFDFEYRGIEISPAAVALAHRDHPGINVELGDLLAREASTGWADLAICIEVLEHLSYPSAAVESIRYWTARDALVSVPWEPYFRLGSLLRGKHLGRLGIHPGHVQQFNPDSLRALLARQFNQVRIVSSFPWLIAVAR